MKAQTRTRDVVALSGASRISRVVVSDESAFFSLRSEWEQLVSQMRSKTALQEWAYLISWWETFGKCDPKTRRLGDLHVLVVREGDETIGILPFFATRKGSFSLFPKRLRPFGYAGRLEPYDLTEEPIVAIKPGCEATVLSETQQWMEAGLRQGRWDCGVLSWFGEVMPSESRRSWKRFRRKPGPAYVALPDSWDKFRKSLSKSMRDNLPYYGRLLVRKGHSWQVDVAEIGPEWHRAVNELIRLHRLRACMSNDPDRVDHLSTAAHRDFLNAVHDTFRGESRTFIGLLRVDEEVVAAQLYYEDSRTLVISYSGYDLKWSSFSPLLVLQAEIIKRTIDRGTQRLDFLCGEAQWQERWQPIREFPINKLTLASKRPLATIRCINYVLVREIFIYWNKCRVSRWIKRNRLLSSLQSFGQAIYFGSARYSHLLATHRPRLHF